VQASGLADYIDGLMGKEEPQLADMRREAAARGIPEIQVPVAMGRLLEVLVAASGARRALEIGTLFGYSAILIARSLPDGGRLTTIEASAKHAEVARANFERAGVADRIELLEGSASDVLPRLTDRQFDFVFIDADKASYPHYLHWSLRLAHPGTVIVADNLWRQGRVVTPDDPDSDGMARFNRDVMGDERLLTAMFPRPGDREDAMSVSVVR
jgi:predicted O-methyltransferase YrrM